MINGNNFTTNIVTVTARIDLQKPELLMRTLRNNANNPLIVLEAQNEAFIVCRPINRSNTFTIAYSKMNKVTCDDNDTWYSLHFDPQEKSLETAVEEFLDFAKKLFNDKKEELLKQARELEKAISSLTTSNLS